MIISEYLSYISLRVARLCIFQSHLSFMKIELIKPVHSWLCILGIFELCEPYPFRTAFAVLQNLQLSHLQIMVFEKIQKVFFPYSESKILNKNFGTFFNVVFRLLLLRGICWFLMPFLGRLPIVNLNVDVVEPICIVRISAVVRGLVPVVAKTRRFSAVLVAFRPVSILFVLWRLPRTERTAAAFAIERRRRPPWFLEVLLEIGSTKALVPSMLGIAATIPPRASTFGVISNV